MGNASEEVIIHLMQSKCKPILLYCFECLKLTASDVKALNFVINRFIMKFFKTSSLELIEQAAYYFNVDLPSELIKIRTEKYAKKCWKLLCTVGSAMFKCKSNA